VSADGQRVVFTGDRDASGWGNVTLWEASTSATRVVAPGVSNAVESISANGRWAVFSSSTANLVPNDTNGTYDVFVVPLDE
jgi:Tol biopolymer transport system component